MNRLFSIVGKMPDKLWGPLAGGGLILVIGFSGLAANLPWLFTSLGPSAYLHTDRVYDKASRPYNLIVGHLIAMAAGFFAIFVVNAWNDPSVVGTTYLTTGRILASVLGLVITIPVQILLRASHPPAPATALLITLGDFQTARGALALFAGIMLTGIIGEGLRQLRVKSQEYLKRRGKL